MASAIEIFFCYAREDEELRKGLEKQLRALKRQGLIDVWHDRNISAGSDWEREIDKHLNTAQIILLLVSPDFMDSDYCYSIEMKRAMERHEQGEARVIPIILRPVYWQGAPFGKLQALPADARAVTGPSWHNQDEAFFNVANGILEKVVELSKDQWLAESEELYIARRYEEALFLYERLIRLDATCIDAYKGKGNVLYYLGQFNEALAAYERALELDPHNIVTFQGKGNVLHAQNRLEEALEAFEQAIRINPNFAPAWCSRGNILYDLKRYEKANLAYERAIQLDYTFASAYFGKGNTLRNMKRPEDALITYERAILLSPNDATLYNSKGEVLRDLQRHQEALAAFEQATQLDPKNVHFRKNRDTLYMQVKVPTSTDAEARYKVGVSPDARQYLIEQLWYTWSNSGISNRQGWQVRAASTGLMDMSSERIKTLIPHLNYRLPEGIYHIDPREAPICLALVETKKERILVNKVYTGYDGVGRPGAYFAHLLAGLSEGFTAREAISLWKSPIWTSSDEMIPPTHKRLPQIRSSDLLIKSGPLTEYDVLRLKEHLPFVIQAFLSLKENQRIYIAASSEIVAALIWGITRCLPRSLIRKLTFSTYEPDVTNSSEVIVGTSWPNTLSDMNRNDRQELPTPCYKDGLAINCYSGKHSDLPTFPDAESFAIFATHSLVSQEKGCMC